MLPFSKKTLVQASRSGEQRQLPHVDRDSVKDWIGCPATPSSLSALVGAIVPGQLRNLETVFEVVGLQVLGISSVKTDTDVWLIDSCVKCKKNSTVRGLTSKLAIL